MQRWLLLILSMLLLSACNFGGQQSAPPTSVQATLATATTIPATVSVTAPSPTSVATAIGTSAAAVASPNTAQATTVSPATLAATATSTITSQRPTSAATQVASNVPASATSAPTTVLPSQTAVPTTVSTNAPPATSAPAAVNPSSSAAPRVLAWNKDDKLVAWYATSGQPQKIAEGPATRVLGCGVNPTGDQMMLYRGDSTGQPNLIPLTGNEPPVTLGDASALGCELSGRTAFSPDGNRLAYIKYAPDATVGTDFTTGTLRILKLPGAAEITSFDKVTAFDLQNDGAVILKFLANAKGQADRADLTWWDAASSKERALETNFSSLENCTFSSGRVLRVGDKVYTALGERCTRPVGSSYRVLRTDFAGGNSINFVDKTPTGGKYYVNTNTNDLFPLPDGKGLLLVYPNGLSTDVGNLARINLADGRVTPVLSAVVTDQSPPSMPHRFLRNSQGTQLALVTRNGNNGETLYVYDLTKPDSDPAQITDLNRSNRINALAWNKTGDRLVYLVSGDDPSLSYIDLKGEKKLVVRGVFQGLVINPDGTLAATSEQVLADKNDLRNNLVMFSLSDGARTKLVEGQKGDSALVPITMR